MFMKTIILILFLSGIAQASPQVLSSGSVTLKKIKPDADNCDSSALLDLNLNFHFATGKTNLATAGARFTEAALFNGLQAEFEEHTDANTKLRATKTATAAGYELITKMEIDLVVVRATRENKTVCTETIQPGKWIKSCSIDLSYKDGKTTFESSVNTVTCTEATDQSIDCIYSQQTIMKPYCSFFVDQSAMALSLESLSRTFRVQSGIAQQIELGGSTNAHAAYSAYRKTPAEKIIDTLYRENKWDIDDSKFITKSF